MCDGSSTKEDSCDISYGYSDANEDSPLSEIAVLGNAAKLCNFPEWDGCCDDILAHLCNGRGFCVADVHVKGSISDSVLAKTLPNSVTAHLASDRVTSAFVHDAVDTGHPHNFGTPPLVGDEVTPSDTSTVGIDHIVDTLAGKGVVIAVVGRDIASSMTHRKALDYG